MSYPIDRAQGTPKPERHLVEVYNPNFGWTTLETRQAERLMVPSTKSLEFRALPARFFDDVHYLCYNVKVKSDFPKKQTRWVQDQFLDQWQEIEVSKPVRLCNLARKRLVGVTSAGQDQDIDLAEQDVTPTNEDLGIHLVCCKAEDGRGP